MNILKTFKKLSFLKVQGVKTFKNPSFLKVGKFKILQKPSDLKVVMLKTFKNLQIEGYNSRPGLHGVLCGDRTTFHD